MSTSKEERPATIGLYITFQHNFSLVITGITYDTCTTPFSFSIPICSLFCFCILFTGVMTHPPSPYLS